MKIIVVILILISSLVHANESQKPKTYVLPSLNKTPKSLFLVKKAKIDNDVGEPVLYPGEKQSKLLTNEKIFNKYRLQILDFKENDWNGGQ